MRLPLRTSLVLTVLTAAPLLAQDTSSTQPTTLPATTLPADDPSARKVENLSKVFRITVANGFLSVTTDLDPADTPVRVAHPDLPGGGQLTTMITGAGDQAELRRFDFMTPPDTVADPASKTAVTAMANGVQISQFGQTETTLSSVQYIQQVPFDAEEAAVADPAVKLYVDRTDVATGQARLKLKLFAASFDDLRRRYPREVSEHLVPLLALLQQDASVFAPDPAVARRALSGEVTADADVAREVASLVPQLAAEDPTARERAYAALQGLGEPGTVVLSKLDRSKLSAEQNSQIDLLLAEQMPATNEQLRTLGGDPSFLLDCLYLTDADLRARAFERLTAVTKLPLTFDPNAPESARRKQALTVRQQVLKWSATQPAAAGVDGQ